jgi:hypothetical protein
MRCVSGAFRPVLGRLTTVRVDIQAGAIARMSFASIESLCRVIVSDAGRIDRQRRAHPFVLADVRSRKYIAQGKAEGRSEGKAELVSRQLSIRFGTLDSQVQARIQRASIAELETIGERLLTARTLDEALGS